MRWPVLLLIGLGAAAPAADRKPLVSSFDRLRVEGPFRVTVTTGRSPGAAIAGDPRAAELVEVRQEGATVTVRRAPVAEEDARGLPREPIAVALTTPALASATLVGAGAITVTGLKASRTDLSVAGTGTIAVTEADGAELNAMVIGAGRIGVAGRAGRARLIVNGAGTIDAGALDAGELAVRLDGPGEVSGRARFTATISATGLGRVTVAGAAKCVISSGAGGPVRCGSAAR